MFLLLSFWRKLRKYQRNKKYSRKYGNRAHREGTHKVNEKSAIITFQIAV
jgi:hypothetical protein